MTVYDKNIRSQNIRKISDMAISTIDAKLISNSKTVTIDVSPSIDRDTL
jgi:hypothetical protein